MFRRAMLYPTALSQVPPPTATVAARRRGYWSALEALAVQAADDGDLEFDEQEAWERLSLVARAKLRRLE
jgi:hypothetical protein